MTRSLGILLAVAVMHPVVLCAQQSERSARWGVAASITPSWSVLQQVGDYVGADVYRISGAEFSIGFVRGRDYGGDWGVSFVWKGVSEGSTSKFGTQQTCVGGNCAENSTTRVARHVAMLGVEAHRFLPLLTVRRGVQIGVNAAAGFLRVRGRVERTDRYAGFELDPATDSVVLAQKAAVSEAAAGRLFTSAKNVENMLSLKLEAGVGLVVNRSLKARVTAGLGFPGYRVASVSLIYLFGRPGPQSIFR